MMEATFPEAGLCTSPTDSPSLCHNNIMMSLWETEGSEDDNLLTIFKSFDVLGLLFPKHDLTKYDMFSKNVNYLTLW